MSRAKILIVEDDREMRHGLNVRLRAHDYDTAFASDAITAVGTAKAEQPDLVILDLGLPGGNGFLLMERFKNFAPLSSVPVIVVTARDSKINKERALEAGARAFFQKPVDNDELLAAIDRALGSTGRTDS